MRMCLLITVLGLCACAVSIEDKWAEVRATDTVEAYRGFKRSFPTSPLAAEADKRITEIHEAEAWEAVLAKDTPEAYASYARMYPESVHAAEAAVKLDAIAKAEAEARAKAAAEAAAGAPVIDMSSDDALAQLEKENPGLDDETRMRLREAEKRVRDEYAPKIEALEAERRTAAAATADSDAKIRNLRTEAKDALERAKQVDDIVRPNRDKMQENVPGTQYTYEQFAAEAERTRNDAKRKNAEADSIEASISEARAKVRALDDRIKALKREERDRVREQLDIITGFKP